MVFSGMASNINNMIRVIIQPIEIVCIQVKKIFSQCIKTGIIEIKWVYEDAGDKPTPYPPAEVVSCLVKEIEVIEARLLPRKKEKVSVFIKYRLKIQITYLDKEENRGAFFIEQELCRLSAPLTGDCSMLPEADIGVSVSACEIYQ